MWVSVCLWASHWTSLRPVLNNTYFQIWFWWLTKIRHDKLLCQGRDMVSASYMFVVAGDIVIRPKHICVNSIIESKWFLPNLCSFGSCVYHSSKINLLSKLSQKCVYYVIPTPVQSNTNCIYLLVFFIQSRLEIGFIVKIDSQCSSKWMLTLKD